MKIKNTLLYAGIIAVMLSSCHKDEEKITQIDLTLKNLLTLLDKSSDYIMQASPGVLDEAGDDYMYFYVEDAIENIDEAYLYYDFSDGRCRYMVIVSNKLNSLVDARFLMDMTENEIGDGYYYLSYDESDSVTLEDEYESFDALWEYIDTNNVIVENVNEVSAYYLYGDYYFISGGVAYPEEDFFMPMLEIGYYDDLLKNAGKTENNGMGRVKPGSGLMHRIMSGVKPFTGGISR